MSTCLPVLYALYVAKSSLQGLRNTVLSLFSGVMEFMTRTEVVFTLPLLIGFEKIFFAGVSA